MLIIENGAGAPGPERVDLVWATRDGTVLHDGPVLGKEARTFEAGARLGSIWIEFATEARGSERIAIVTGFVEDEVVSQGATRAVLQGGGKWLVRLTPGRLADRDFDRFPDEVDGCPDHRGMMCPSAKPQDAGSADASGDGVEAEHELDAVPEAMLSDVALDTAGGDTGIDGAVVDGDAGDDARPSPTLPPTPTGVVASPEAESVRLSWSPHEAALSYTIKRRLDAGHATIATVGAPPFVDTTAPPGARACYVVVASNVFGDSAPSDEACATPAPPARIHLTPTDDTYASQRLPTTPMGGQAQVRVKRHRQSTVEREALLKFDIRGLTGPVKQARLRLFLESAPTYAVSDAAHVVEDLAWNEGALTWATRPAFGSQLATARLTELGRYYDWDVTAYLNTRLGMADAVAFGVRAVDLSDTIREYASKESPYVDRRPQLLVDR